MDVSHTGWSVSRTWRDEHDVRLPLTRANLHVDGCTPRDKAQARALLKRLARREHADRSGEDVPLVVDFRGGGPGVIVTSLRR